MSETLPGLGLDESISTLETSIRAIWTDLLDTMRRSSMAIRNLLSFLGLWITSTQIIVVGIWTSIYWDLKVNGSIFCKLLDHLAWTAILVTNHFLRVDFLDLFFGLSIYDCNSCSMYFWIIFMVYFVTFVHANRCTYIVNILYSVFLCMYLYDG